MAARAQTKSVPLSINEKDALARKEKRELLQRLENRRMRETKHNFTEFCRYIDIPGVPANDNEDCELFYPANINLAPHHVLITEKLQEVADGKIKNLMILMPPGSAKSSYASVAFPVWFMGRYPGKNIICTSYASDLSRKLGRRARQIAKSEKFLEVMGTTLTGDNAAVDDWSLLNGSTYMSGGILSGITGNRADILLVDDPFAGRDEAESPKIREKTWEAWKSDLRTRVKPTGAKIIINTRWHEGDLSGMILPEDYNGESGWITSRDGEQWYVLCLQAQCERDDDPLGRKIGEYLWTEWFDEEWWENEKRIQGERNWNSLYQQRPSSLEGGILPRNLWLPWGYEHKAGKIVDPRKPLPKVDLIFQVYDTAFKEKEKNDFSSRTTWGVFMAEDKRGKMVPNLLLMEAWQDKLSYPKLKRKVIQSAIDYKPDFIMIEDRANGQSLIQDLRETAKMPPVKRFDPKDKSKEYRANLASVVLESGLVWYVPRKWSEKVIMQCAKFPNDQHDDFVDTVVMAMLYVRFKYILGLPEDEDEDTDYMHQISSPSQRRGYGQI